MTTELTYLTWVTTLTALIWIPYILNMIMVRGLVDAVGYPEDPAPLSPWAASMKAAHSNAVENLVVFGPGDIAQAHTIDEWIALDQLERGTEQYTRLIRTWCC